MVLADESEVAVGLPAQILELQEPVRGVRINVELERFSELLHLRRRGVGRRRDTRVVLAVEGQHGSLDLSGPRRPPGDGLLRGSLRGRLEGIQHADRGKPRPHRPP